MSVSKISSSSQPPVSVQTRSPTEGEKKIESATASQLEASALGSTPTGAISSTPSDHEISAEAVRNAAQNGNLRIIQELLRIGMGIRMEDRTRALVEASQGGHLAIVKELLKDGAVFKEPRAEVPMEDVD